MVNLEPAVVFSTTFSFLWLKRNTLGTAPHVLAANVFLIAVRGISLDNYISQPQTSANWLLSADPDQVWAVRGECFLGLEAPEEQMASEMFRAPAFQP